MVGQAAAADFKPCSLEMGGKNAMIVLEDANLDLALEGAVWGAFGTTGQRCTATSRIILHQAIAGELPEGSWSEPGRCAWAMVSTNRPRSVHRSMSSRSRLRAGYACDRDSGRRAAADRRPS